jgi:hypothetical protein
MGHCFAPRDRWGKVADALNKATDRGELVGADTEFWGPDGYDVRKMSPAGGRAFVHLWSVAVKRHPLRLNPRGYHEADAAVMLVDSLEHPPIRSWLESSAPKVFHNLSVDFHSLANHGVKIGGAVDSLEHSRWVWPGRARGPGFSLDSLGWDILGAGKTEDFADVFSVEQEELVKMKTVKRTVCSCGVEKCRKRKGHEKSKLEEEVPVVKRVVKKIPLQSVVPGHSRWERAVAYAARDAVLALNLSDVISREMRREVVWPWG